MIYIFQGDKTVDILKCTQVFMHVERAHRWKLIPSLPSYITKKWECRQVGVYIKEILFKKDNFD